MVFNLKNKIKEEILKNNLVAIQTETVYGIFSLVSIDNKEKINNFKKRDKDKPLQVSFGSFKQIFEWIDCNKIQKKILYDNLPSSSSFLLKAKKSKVKILGNENILIRFPNMNKDDFLLKLLLEIGPLFSTSVNFHNKKELKNCFEIEKKMNIICYENKNIDFKNKSSKIISILNNKMEIIRE